MYRTNYQDAGNFLKKIRAVDFPTRRQFASACGAAISYDRIADLENGRRQPTARDLQIYQRLTRCEAAQLLKIPIKNYDQLSAPSGTDGGGTISFVPSAIRKL
jgi:transcriptional regulator with XRE-family HTH domain